MDRTWTWRDWIFLTLFVLLVVLIFLQILQNDRQYDRLNDIAEDFSAFRKMIAQGGAPVGTGSSSATDNDARAAHPKGDWLVYRIVEPAGTLNPVTSKDAYAGSVNGYIMESFLRRDPATLKLVPNLAESMPEISEDKKQFTFRLRKGIRWHDGEELTADDVVFSFNTIMNPKVEAQNLRGYYEDIDKIEKLDRYTVRFTAKTVYWRWVTMLGGMDIVPEHLYRYDPEHPEEFNRNPWGYKPVGTGPYRFLKWTKGQEIVLVRNQEYWNKAREPYIDRIVFKFVLDPSAAIEHVRKEEIDYYNVEPEQWDREAVEPSIAGNYRRIRTNALNFDYIGWNQRRIFFEDSRVRRAMTHAFPRQHFLETRMKGLGRVVTGNFYVGSDAYDRTIEPIPYDLDRARALLDEAGWEDTDGDGIRDKDGQKFEFQLMTARARPIRRDYALTLKTEFAKLGIKVNIKEIDWPSLLSEIDNRNFDAVILGWGLSLEPDPHQLWHSSQTGPSGSNYCSFSDARADELIMLARREFDEAKRNEYFHEFHRILHREQPYTFLYNKPTLVLLHRRFQGVTVYELGTDDNEWYVPPENQKYGVIR